VRCLAAPRHCAVRPTGGACPSYRIEENGTHTMVETTDPARAVTDITGGIDTHADTHTIAAIDGLGRLLGHARFPVTTPGFDDLLA
jgi:hypothetical protein